MICLRAIVFLSIVITSHICSAAGEERREAPAPSTTPAFRVGSGDALDEAVKKADSGDKDAALRVARIFQSGLHGTPRDELKTLEWMRRASALGSADASYALSRWHRSRGEDREMVRYERLSFEQARSAGTVPDRVPPAVRALADAYVASMAPEPPERRPDAWSRYVSDFFLAYTRSPAALGGRDELAASAFRAGQEYRRTHPDTLSSIMQGFGYVPVEAQGTLGSDQLTLYYTQEVWGFDSLRGPGVEDPGLRPPIRGGVVRVRGYFSPPGRYGPRFGGTRFQLLAVSVMPATD